MRRQEVPLRLLLQDGRENVRDRLAVEGGSAGEELEEHAAERPDIRALVDGAAARLLGTHVGRAAEDNALAGAGRGHGRRLRGIAFATRIGDGLREAEVE